MPKNKTDNLPEPLIIQRSDHVVSRNDIDREALKVLYRLRDAGFTAYLVGGGVRDILLGNTPKDFDISTDARPGQLRKIFRNSRIIGRRFRLVQVFFKGGKIIEVSTFRCRGEYDANGQNEVLPSNNTFGNAAEDAFRRDLTINALFYEIENFTVIDYTGGVADLNKGIIRLIGDPEKRITRDPVRIMRAIRHAARNNFTIEEKTWQAILKHHNLLSQCPDSRLRDEFFKDVKAGIFQPWLRLAVESNTLPYLLPCYEMIDASEEAWTLLQNIAATIDRLHKASGKAMPEPMLMALILLPHAIATRNLLQPRRGPEFFSFSRQLRTDLDTILQKLNIKKADKEIITGLLTNLTTFEANKTQKQWPAKLKRKSYFKQGLQFYDIYREACGGEKAVTLDLPAAPKKRSKPKPPRTYKKSNRGPAFAKKTKGGIFGFKK